LGLLPYSSAKADMIAADEPPSLLSTPRPPRPPSGLSMTGGLDSDVGPAPDRATSLGYVEGSTGGCPGGLWSHGSCDAAPAGGDERDIGLGVRVEHAMRDMVRDMEAEGSDL